MNHFILTVWCLITVMLVLPAQGMAETGAPDIALYNWHNQNLSAQAHYLIDPDAKETFQSVIASPSWQPVEEGRLLFDSMKETVWLTTTWSTRSSYSGISAPQPAILELHRLIDFVDAQLYANGELIMKTSRGAFLSAPAGFVGTNKNILRLHLQPHSDYRLYVRLSGNSLISTSMTLWEEEAYRYYDQKIMYLFIAYAAVVLTIAFYNVGAFVSTRYRVFGYHALFAVSMLLLQVSQYGYLDAWLSSDVFAWRELLTTLALIGGYTAILAFTMAIVEHRDTPVFYVWGNSIHAINGLLLLAYPFLGFGSVMTLLVVNVVSGILLGTIHIGYLWLNQARVKAVQLTTLLLLFVPAGTMALLSRLGVFSQSLVSDYLTLLLIVAELVIVSIFLFAEMRGIHNRFLQARFSDPRNQIPNILAMKRRLNRLWRARRPFALTYVWFYGLERMEIARGTDFVDFHIRMIARLMNEQLRLSSLVDGKLANNKLSLVFYCEKNTLGLVTASLSSETQQQLQAMLLQVVASVKQEQAYAMDISPVIASSNMVFRNKPFAQPEDVIENTTLTLSQCIQRNESLLLYSEDIGLSERRRIALINDFEHALEHDEFYLHWQPQIDVEGRHLAGLETLVRWHHPQYGDIIPSHFIPMLEQDARITQLSLWVLRKVFTVAPRILEQHPQLDISINLSVYDLMGDGLLPALDQLLQGADKRLAQHIVLEVTESVHIEDNQKVAATVKALQARGFRLSVDDFGSGYASFGYLQTLTLNEIKIDRRYTETCHEPNSQAIIRSIIDMAKRLQLTVVVEGIENQQQQDYFTAWGADRLQGWHLSKPLSFNEVLTYQP